MNAIVSSWLNPYSGVAVSAVTSNVVDVTRTLAWTFSWRTTAGSVSTHTLQLSCSNDSTAGFVNSTVFGTGTPAVIEGQNAVRWARFQREPSGASVTIDLNRVEG